VISRDLAPRAPGMDVATWRVASMRILAYPAALAAVLAGASACSPLTSYRYTGYVPASHAMAWDGRTAKDGSIRVEGSMVQATVDRNIDPKIHDTALRVPNVTLEGAAFIALFPGFEIGGRYAYAAYAWGEPSAQGTLELPSHPSLWGVGPEMRATIPFDKKKKFALGIGGSWMRYETPYAEWQLVPNCDITHSDCFYDTYAQNKNAGVYYKLVDEKSESHTALSIAVIPSIQLGDGDEYGHVFGGFTMHTGFKNDGFTNTAQNGSTIQDAGLVTIVGVGYGISLQPVRFAGMVSLPLTTGSSPINYSIGGFFTIGVDLELWESREDRRRREREEQERVAPPPPIYVVPGGAAPQQ
jgi:hypothetical protein